jgi:hypothetical protein
MAVFQLYPKRRVRQKLDNDTIEFEKFFFSHVFSSLGDSSVGHLSCAVTWPSMAEISSKKGRLSTDMA